jgi:hypothetical protein
MRTVILSLAIWVGGMGILHAATRGDVKVLEASDTIKYRINHFAKNYILYYRFPKKTRLRKELERDLEELGKGFQIIAVTTKDIKTKNLLAYFAYEKARIGEILSQQPDRESLDEILQMSESFIEGADSIAKHHAYDFAFEEKMYIQTRSLAQKLEEILKYYMASRIIRNDPELTKKMGRSVADFNKTLRLINEYEYEDRTISKIKERLNRTWNATEKYVTRNSGKDLPLVMNVAAGRIETFLDEIGIYHSKNQ